MVIRRPSRAAVSAAFFGAGGGYRYLVVGLKNRRIGATGPRRVGQANRVTAAIARSVAKNAGGKAEQLIGVVPDLWQSRDLKGTEAAREITVFCLKRRRYRPRDGDRLFHVAGLQRDIDSLNRFRGHADIRYHGLPETCG